MGWGLVVVGLMAVGVSLALRQPWRPGAQPLTTTAEEYERYARERFQNEHPGAQPLTERIGATAVAYHRSRPMGKYVLSLQRGKWGNDCSDFVECIVDEAVGVKARFRRGSDRHLVGTSVAYFAPVSWDRQTPLWPGDVIAIAHSPWYVRGRHPSWHIGVVGSDGLVYDFVKLKRWPRARYGRNTPQWFVRHAQGVGEVVVQRLRPEYAYLLAPVKAGAGHY